MPLMLAMSSHLFRSPESRKSSVHSIAIYFPALLQNLASHRAFTVSAIIFSSLSDLVERIHSYIIRILEKFFGRLRYWFVGV